MLCHAADNTNYTGKDSANSSSHKKDLANFVTSLNSRSYILISSCRPKDQTHHVVIQASFSVPLITLSLLSFVNLNSAGYSPYINPPPPPSTSSPSTVTFSLPFCSPAKLEQRWAGGLAILLLPYRFLF